jgi:tRNA 2-thiouridine synthesizing protein A
MNITILNVKGLACPLPVLRAKRALKDVAVGDVLRVHATDPASLKDMPKLCEQTGHTLVNWAVENEVYVFDIMRRT